MMPVWLTLAVPYAEHAASISQRVLSAVLAEVEAARQCRRRRRGAGARVGSRMWVEHERVLAERDRLAEEMGLVADAIVEIAHTVSRIEICDREIRRLNATSTAKFGHIPLVLSGAAPRYHGLISGRLGLGRVRCCCGAAVARHKGAPRLWTAQWLRLRPSGEPLNRGLLCDRSPPAHSSDLKEITPAPPDARLIPIFSSHQCPVQMKV